MDVISQHISNHNLVAQLMVTHHVSGKMLALATFKVAQDLAPGASVKPGDHATWLQVFANLDIDAQRDYIAAAKSQTASWAE